MTQLEKLVVNRNVFSPQVASGVSTEGPRISYQQHQQQAHPSTPTPTTATVALIATVALKEGESEVLFVFGTYFCVSVFQQSQY